MATGWNRRFWAVNCRLSFEALPNGVWLYFCTLRWSCTQTENCMFCSLFWYYYIWIFRLYCSFLVLNSFWSKPFSIFTKLCSKSWFLQAHYNTQKSGIAKTQRSSRPFTKEWLRLICVPLEAVWDFANSKLCRDDIINMKVYSLLD